MSDLTSFNITQIETKDLYNAIKNKEEFVLLDVRTPQEYEKNKIEGSINLPIDNVKEKVERLIPDKNIRIYVYCLSGSRSAVAAQTLITLGYKDVIDVKNGLLAWRVNNLPTV